MSGGTSDTDRGGVSHTYMHTEQTHEGSAHISTINQSTQRPTRIRNINRIPTLPSSPSCTRPSTPGPTPSRPRRRPSARRMMSPIMMMMSSPPQFLLVERGGPMWVKPSEEFLGASTVTIDDFAGGGVLDNASCEAEGLRHV